MEKFEATEIEINLVMPVGSRENPLVSNLSRYLGYHRQVNSLLLENWESKVRVLELWKVQTNALGKFANQV